MSKSREDQLKDPGMRDYGPLEQDVCWESRMVLNSQIRKIEKSDQKAMSLFRSNILLLGLILTALSIIVYSDGREIGYFVNVGSIVGVIFLMASTFLAAVAYTSSSFDIGIGTEIIDRSTDSSYDTNDFHSDVIESYQEGIEHNSDVVSFNAVIITLTLMASYSSIVLLLGGTIIGATKTRYTFESMLFVVILVIICICVSWIIYNSENIFLRLYSRDE